MSTTSRKKLAGYLHWAATGLLAMAAFFPSAIKAGIQTAAAVIEAGAQQVSDSAEESESK